MARKSACEKLLDLVDTHPRFLLAGPAASMVFIRLVRLMAQLGDASVLRLGFVFGSWKEVAFGLRISETELETHLETLAQRGVIDRDETSLTLPDWLGVRDRRAEAARENGKKGGRPRKNAADPRQGWMPLPISGGGALDAVEETQETECETQGVWKPDACTTTSSSERESSGTTDAPWVSLTRELAALLNLDPNDRHPTKLVKSWLQAGASPQWLRDVFVEVMARKNPPPVPSFSYLGKVISPRLGRISSQPAEPSVARAMTAEQRLRAQELDQIRDRWAREGYTAPFPPKRDEWVFGEVSDRARWLLYRTKGPAAFRQAA